MPPHRYPDPDRDTLDEERGAAYDLIAARRGKVPAPFVPLLESPRVADLFEQLSTVLWSSLPADLLEAVFLMTAVHCRCAHQWRTHVPKALAAGLAPADVARLSKGDPLVDGTLADVQRFVTALLRHQPVPQALHATLTTRLSARGVVDLAMFCASAQTVAMLLNLRDDPMPDGMPMPA